MFLFDEPASNLHSSAQTALLASLAELSAQAVVIYATHSQYLIEPKWLDSTFVVANEGLDPAGVSADFNARSTDVVVHPYRRFAATHPKQAHYFQPVLDVLDWAPSRLEMVPSAVMIEGKGDFYLLSYFQEIVLGLTATERLHLLPGGGAGTLDLPFQLYLAWGRPFVALLDSDKAGNREYDRYVKKFGVILVPRLLTLAEASRVKDVRGIESVLMEKDRLTIQRVADPSATRFRKKDFARGVQEALVANRKVQISAVSRRRIEKVLKTLADRMEAAEHSDAASVGS